jgi:hypothetical protein
MNKSLKYLDYIAYIESGLCSISAKDPLKNRAKDSSKRFEANCSVLLGDASSDAISC